jgi:hypothetical protein
MLHNELNTEANETPLSKRNIFRTKEYMKLNHCIKSCTNYKQLETIKELVLEYYKQKKQDAPELMANYLERKHDLNPTI